MNRPNFPDRSVVKEAEKKADAWLGLLALAVLGAAFLIGLVTGIAIGVFYL